MNIFTYLSIIELVYMLTITCSYFFCIYNYLENKTKYHNEDSHINFRLKYNPYFFFLPFICLPFIKIIKSKRKKYYLDLKYSNDINYNRNKKLKKLMKNG